MSSPVAVTEVDGITRVEENNVKERLGPSRALTRSDRFSFPLTSPTMIPIAVNNNATRMTPEMINIRLNLRFLFSASSLPIVGESMPSVYIAAAGSL